MSTLKVTNIIPQSGTNVYVTGSLTVSEVITARELRTELTQSLVLFESGSTKFGDTSDDNHTFTGSLLINGTVSIPGFSDVSASIATNETDIDALQVDSASDSTRITTNEVSISNLQSDSGSFSTRVTANENNITSNDTDISSLTTASGSFSTRVTTNETNITALESFSSSLDSTYATDAEVSTAVSSLNLATGSYATTGSNTFVDNQIISGTIDATGATSKVRFLYATTGDLPAAADYHGMFAHVHAEGAAYYAHAGNWVELANSSSFATDIESNVTNVTTLTGETGSYASTGSNTFTGDQIVSSSVLLTLQPVDASPASATTGSLIVSGSPAQLYIFNGSGSGWNRV